jgi:hypothetical protein
MILNEVKTNPDETTEEGVYRVCVTATINRYIDIQAPSQDFANEKAKRMYLKQFYAGTNQYDWEKDPEQFESVFDADI